MWEFTSQGGSIKKMMGTVDPVFLQDESLYGLKQFCDSTTFMEMRRNLAAVPA